VLRLALRRKAVVIIQDGVGDRPIAELGAKTPLQAANIPFFDKMAAGGICGLVDPIAPGVRCGTDVGHMALFGLDPYRD
jgi:2,3-bisphosphoglycerate-independent phosphoglycerate mutase